MSERKIAGTPSAYSYPLLIKQLLHAPFKVRWFALTKGFVRYWLFEHSGAEIPARGKLWQQSSSARRGCAWNMCL
jgi:hypothetical protein